MLLATDLSSQNRP